MAKYEVLVDTLGANPTYSKGDIIEDGGDLKAPYDFPWLLRSGAIKRAGDADRPTPASETLASAPTPAGLAVSAPAPLPGAAMPGSGAGGAPDPLADLDDDQRQALADAGIRTADDVRGASDEQLRGVKGIGPATLTKLREATK